MKPLKIALFAGIVTAAVIALRRQRAGHASDIALPGSDLPRSQGYRDPEDRPVAGGSMAARERSLDKTIADSFPTSDPPSSIPNPAA